VKTACCCNVQLSGVSTSLSQGPQKSLISHTIWNSLPDSLRNPTIGGDSCRLEGHLVERMYLRRSCSHGSRWIKPFENHASLQRRAPSTWNFPDVIKFRVAAHTISEKAIRLRHPDYNPDRAQKLISSSMSRHLSTRNISSKFKHAFLSNLANRQTNRQTNAGKRIYLLLCRR